MRRLFIVLFCCMLAFTFTGCAAPEESIDVCGQEISVPKDTESEIVIEISNCVSQVDGYEYPTDLTTLKGNPDVLTTKAENTFNNYRKQFPDCSFKVVSINGKQVK